MKIASYNVSEGGSRSRFMQYFAAISATMGIICSNMHYGWPSPSSPQLLKGDYYFKISSEEDSWLAVTPLIGATIGAFGAGAVVDHFGRKRLILASSVPYLISWLLVAIARSSLLMFVGRFIAGLCDGVSYTVVPMYLGEIAEPKIRGFIGSVCSVSSIFGILMINILGLFLPIDTTAYISLIIPALLLITFIGIPGSPYFLVTKGRTEEAIKSLQIFRGTSDVRIEFERISKAVKDQNSQHEGHFCDLLTVKSNRRALFIAMGLRGFQQLSGTSAITFYCKTVFEESTNIISPKTATIIYSSVQLFLSCLSSVTVDMAGRRMLLIISDIGATTSLFLNGTYLYLKNSTDVDTSRFNFIPIVTLVSFVIVFSVGWQNIPLLIIGEIFPTNVKGIALSFLDIYYAVLLSIISQFFYWSNEELGLHVSFFTFGSCCLLGLIFIIIFVPETKNKTLEDIQEDIKNGNYGWSKKSCK